MEEKGRSEYVYKTTLKTVYGLPDSWIARLGEPDQFVPNPHYRSGPPSSLYLRVRVEMLIEENQAEYDAMIAGRAARQARARIIVDQRAQALIAWAGAVEIVTRPLPERYETLIEEVTAFYAWRAYERGREEWYGEIGRGAVVAHGRHRYTNYEKLLQQIEGSPGCAEAYLILKERCNIVVEGMLKQRYEAVECINAEEILS